jgi:hypothetical protein
MIRGTLNVKHIRAYWGEILRLVNSIQQGMVTGIADAAQSRQLTLARTSWPWRCAS